MGMGVKAANQMPSHQGIWKGTEDAENLRWCLELASMSLGAVGVAIHIRSRPSLFKEKWESVNT